MIPERTGFKRMPCLPEEGEEKTGPTKEQEQEVLLQVAQLQQQQDRRHGKDVKLKCQTGRSVCKESHI